MPARQIVFSKLQYDQLRAHQNARFTASVQRQMAEDCPDFAALPPEHQTDTLATSFQAARTRGLRSERALAFWANLDWRLPHGWDTDPAVNAVFDDTHCSEPERLFRLKTALKNTQWSG